MVTANIATDAQKYGVVKETDVVRQKYLEAKRVLKSKMEQEQRNSRANSLKIQTLWRKIMRINKVDGLRKEIEVLSQNHERDVDRKDAIIQVGGSCVVGGGVLFCFSMRSLLLAHFYLLTSAPHLIFHHPPGVSPLNFTAIAFPSPFPIKRSF